VTLRSVQNGLDDYRTWATDPLPRVGMGLPFFDDRTNGGLAKAECMMVLAYSSVGKTSIALNMLAQNPRVPAVFFSLEMSWRQVVARMTALTSGIPTWDLEKLLKQGTVPQQVVAGQKLGQPVGLVVIDYLELIGGAGMLGKSEQVDRAAQKIRSLAKDCDTRVVVLHQVAKTDGSAGHEPLSLDSGKFGGHHPMDYVIGAYAPRLDRKLTEHQQTSVEGELYLQLLKNRNGKAHPSGVRHYQDPVSGRITPFGVTPPLLPAAVSSFQPALVGAPDPDEEPF
jgi:replicative DNA helicase